MDMSISNYDYTPLPPNHIRVLQFTGDLTASQHPSSFTWSLKVVPFLERGSENGRASYDTLSYTWGALSETYPLICDGKVLQIHYNLNEALPYLARRPSKLPIWIDAVCINQSDGEEKVQQIRLMSDIYRRATRVWVWLGVAEEPDASLAVELMLPRLDEAKKAIEMLASDYFLTPQELGLPELDSLAWDALDRIVNNPWFFRLWVVQEAALARSITFLYGAHEISLELVTSAVNGISSLRSVRDEQGRRPKLWDGLLSKSYLLFLCRTRYHNWEESGDMSRDRIIRTIGDICSMTTSHRCFDPRDRVLALLGLIGGGYAKEIQFDETTSTVELYTQFVQFLLLGTDGGWGISAKIFEMAVSTPSTDQKFPSWCPDLHKCGFLEDRMSLPFDQNDQPVPFQASTRQRLSKRGVSTREIVIRGSIFDTVKALGSKLEMFNRSKPSGFYYWMLGFREWEGLARDLALPLLNAPDGGETTTTCANHLTEQDYWLTLLGNHTKIFGADLTYEDFVGTRSFVTKFLAFVEKAGVQR